MIHECGSFPSFVCGPRASGVKGSGVGLNKARVCSVRSCVTYNKRYLTLHSALYTSNGGQSHTGQNL